MKRAICLLLVILTTQASCIHRYSTLQVQELEPAAATTVQTPVRAHLADGTTVLYRQGVSVDADSLRGAGMRFDVLLADSAPVVSVPMDSVVGLESWAVHSDPTKTVTVSTLATIGAIGLVLGGAIAIACIADPKCFGSCPTVYTMESDGEVLEAELFSYSVAPLLEARDVDRIGTRVGGDGFVELEIRNEALETHRINYLGVIAVEHAPDETIVPDARGAPLALAELAAPRRVRDAAGRDVTAAIAARDNAAFASAPQLLASASVDRLHDYLDLTLPPVDADSIAVVLRMRNSLLNTILFYDLMLASAGAQALDWMGGDLQQIGPAVALGEWYAASMGMWVQVDDGGTFRDVARIPDAGPIAWKDVAVVVPITSPTDSVRIRLRFVVDEWRIDRIQVAGRVRRPVAREVPVTHIVDAADMLRADLQAAMKAPDEDYAESLPGQRFTARFDVGAASAASAGGDHGTAPERTFLVAAQGYYTEWVRPDWIRTAQAPQRFVPEDASLVAAIERWRIAKPAFERRFYETRIPVR